jgi:hypothetical protein
MAKILYTSRTPVQQYQRCKRLRWLGNYEGAAGQGLEPARKSSHLVVGGAVHAGMEVLLREGQAAVDLAAGETIDEKLVNVFETLPEGERATIVRRIEDRAVAAALTAFDEDFGTGVELDPEEAASRARQQASMQMGFDPLSATGESPIVIDFSDLGPVK